MNNKLAKARKQNMKIYALYRTISFDLIFYYAIDFLFLTQVKGISASDVTLSSAIYAIFMIILQIPASMLIDKIGTKICALLANIFNAIFVILIMNCVDLSGLIFAQFVSALCYSLKNISDRALLNYSIPETKKKGEIFSRLEGKGSKYYYYINAVTAALSGFLYVINPYIPMMISFSVAVLASIIALGFKDIESYKNLSEDNDIKETEKIEGKEQEVSIEKKVKSYFEELKKGIEFILKSQRLRSLLIYGGLSWGIFALMSTYRSSLLVDIGAPAQVISIIAAIVGIAAGIGSEQQMTFHKKYRNKSLSIILIGTTISILIAGVISVAKIDYITTLVIVTISFIVMHIAKGISGVLATRYLGNFADEKILTQIYAVNAMCENAFRAIISFVGAYLLIITNTANAMILIGIFLLISSLGLISYMKTRLGLKPEQYGEREIYRLRRKKKKIEHIDDKKIV